MKTFASIRRGWANTACVGMGIGWDRNDGTACVFLQLAFWVLVIGPHYPLPRGIP